MKIRTQIFLMGICLSILPLGLVSILLISVYNVEINRIIESDLRSVTIAQIEIIDNFFEERDMNMGILSEYPMIDILLQSSNAGQEVSGTTSQLMMEQILNDQKNKREFLYSITVVDKQFNIVACTEETPVSKAEELAKLDFLDQLSDKAHFSKILNEGEAGTREKCLVAIKSIFNEEQEKVGYFVEEISLDFFENMRITTDLIKQGYIYITDGKGGLITAGSGQEQRKEYVLESNERGNFHDAWEKRDLSQPVGVIRYTIDDKTYLSSYGGFTNASLQILASVCIDDILHTQENFVTVLLIAILITIILFSSINFIMNRKVTTPINHMIETFDQIRIQRDFTKRIEDVPDNEIGIIANEVNGLLEDIKEIMQHQEMHLAILKERAERDSLTNLFNKLAIEEVITMKMENASLKKKTMACVMVDIDDFKNFNTIYGHVGGDKVICYIASLMKEISNDTAGRIGGDEFIMCLDNMESLEAAQGVIDKFMTSIKEGIVLTLGEEPVSIYCSVGVTLIQGKEKISFEEILTRADQVMYDVKNSTKNNYKIEFFHQK